MHLHLADLLAPTNHGAYLTSMPLEPTEFGPNRILPVGTKVVLRAGQQRSGGGKSLSSS